MKVLIRMKRRMLTKKAKVKMVMADGKLEVLIRKVRKKNGSSR